MRRMPMVAPLVPGLQLPQDKGRMVLHSLEVALDILHQCGPGLPVMEAA